MNMIFKPVLAAGIAIVAISAPASAQVNGLATSDIGVAVANSQALQSGLQQVNTTYQAQLTQIEQLMQQRQQLLAPLDTNSDGQLSEEEAGAAPETTVTQVRTLAQQLAEVQVPVQRARLYVVNQVGQNYAPAVEQVMAAKGIQVMLAPAAIDFGGEALDVTGDIVAAINARLPSVSITPPDDWQATQATADLFQQVMQLFTIYAMQQQQLLQQGGQAASGEEVRRN